MPIIRGGGKGSKGNRSNLISTLPDIKAVRPPLIDEIDNKKSPSAAPKGRKSTKSKLRRASVDLRVSEKAEGLISSNKSVRKESLKFLQAHITSVERARDVLGILPTAKEGLVELATIRKLCIDTIRGSLGR